MTKVSILMLPEPGHYLPTLRIAHALRLLGNTISYVTLVHYKTFFEKQGMSAGAKLGHRSPRDRRFAAE